MICNKTILKNITEVLPLSEELILSDGEKVIYVYV